MRKTIPATEENRRSLKQRLRAALAMLLIAVILTVFTSYAWLILSIAPEVKGISTTIGANGSLEIALLTKETFSDPNLVPTLPPGGSLSNNLLEANLTWGNMVDLNDQGYGLQEIVLYPSRLNITGEPGNYKVDRNDGMLLVPTYGADGRIIQLSDKTITGTYGDKGFYSYAGGGYGVRAIGTAASFSAQSSALEQAKRNISTYMSSAVSSAKSSLDGVQDLLLKFAGSSVSFTDSDIDTLKGMIERLQVSEDYIEDALRQGLVAIAASAIADEATFETARSMLLSDTNISTLLNDLGMSVPDMFMTWVNAQEKMENNLNTALAMSNQLDADTATKQDVKDVLDYLMNLDQVLVGDKAFSSLSREDLMGMIGGGIELTLKPGSGIYADIADFTGNYSASVGSMATMKTASNKNPSYLNLLLTVVNSLTAADGGSSAADVKLEDTYGYVLDLAFRCNAYASDLLLQTAGTQRVYSDSESDATMGGGSYMEFATVADMDFETLTKLMDAVRVAFVDDAGNLLGIAKLNVSNRVLNEETGNIMAPLYLYDFHIGTDVLDYGQLIMDYRRKEGNAIASLARNQAKAISTLVWLDGDLVDNTMVSAESNISGVLNLQFASSVNLVPAENDALSKYVNDKDGLAQAVEDAYNNYISLGQRKYTSVSWKNFTEVYNHAKAVSENPLASENQIYNTLLKLEDAKNALRELSDTELNLAIGDVRNTMGTSETNKYLIYEYDADGMPVLLPVEVWNSETKQYENGYTDEQLANSTGVFIKEVTWTDDDWGPSYEDDDNIYGNDGSRFCGPFYTDSSWYSLAEALYVAEAISLNSNATDAHRDAALTILDEAWDAMEPTSYFTAYDLDGELYYKVNNADIADTYGLWWKIEHHYEEYEHDGEVYGSSWIAYEPVTSDLKLIELDAYAVEADIAYIDQVEDIPYAGSDVYWTPEVYLDTDRYPGLENAFVGATNWDVPDGSRPGEYTITADIIASGYVQYECSKNVYIYEKATGVTFDNVVNTISVGEEKALCDAVLDYTGAELYNSTVTYGETISSATWSTSDSDILESLDDNTFKAKKAGSVTVYVTVETVQGNTYSASFDVTVTA